MSPRSTTFLILTLLTLVVANARAAASSSASSLTKAGYLTDSRGTVVRGGSGECWRAGLWTPSLATVVGCDGVLARASPIPLPASAPEETVATAVDTKSSPEIVAESTEPLAEVEKISFDTDALFDFDKSVLKSEGRQRLDLLTSRLKDKLVHVVVALGYTDSIGTQTYNQQLSERRAVAVADYLRGKGIPGEKFVAEGRGASQPIVSNSSEAGRAKNRRVEIEVVAIRPRE